MKRLIVPVVLSFVLQTLILVPASGQGWVEKEAGESAAPSIGSSIKEEPVDAGPVTATALKIDHPAVLPFTHWSTDGKHVFILTLQGRLTKYTVPEWELVAELALPDTSKWMGPSKAGILIQSEKGDRLYLIDPRTLKIRKQAAIETGFLATSPALDYALMWVHTRERPWGKFGMTKSPFLSKIDLRSMKTTNTYRPSDLVGNLDDVRIVPLLGKPFDNGCDDFQITPDGKYLVGGTEGSPQRFRIDGDSIQLEESGYSWPAQSRLILSPDSQYVAEHQRPSADGTTFAVFHIETFLSEIASIGGINKVAAIAFDTAWHEMVAVDQYGKLFRFGPDNKQIGEEAPIPGRGNTINRTLYSNSNGRYSYRRTVGSTSCIQLLAHPSGGRYLVHRDVGMQWCEVRDRVSGSKKKTDWLRSDIEKKHQEALLSRRPYPSDHKLAVAIEEKNDIKVTKLGVLRGFRMAGRPHWTEDGLHMLLVFVNGSIMKISVDTLATDIERCIFKECVDSAQSAEGLLILKEDPSELLILDESTLETRKKIPVHDNAESIICTRVMSSAMLTYRIKTTARHTDQSVTFVDLQTGVQADDIIVTNLAAGVKNARSHPRSDSLFPMRSPVLTPDGKYLVCLGGQSLHRLRVGAGTLTLVASGPPIAGERLGSVSMSPDGVYVSTGVANSIYPDHPHVEPGECVYEIENFFHPVQWFPVGKLAFDPAGKRIYAAGFTVYGSNGERITEFDARTDDLIAHPDGRRLIATRKAGQPLWFEDLTAADESPTGVTVGAPANIQ